MTDTGAPFNSQFQGSQNTLDLSERPVIQQTKSTEPQKGFRWY